MVRSGVVARWRQFWPVTDATPVVSLGEGDTPLVRMPALEAASGANQVWVKFDGANPTGSFKDRGMALAMSKALEHGAHTVICASTGNTSAAAAAYAGRAGLRCVVLVSDAIARGKLAQAQIHGADVVVMDGNFDERLEAAKQICASNPGFEQVNSINPHRLEGQQSAAFEICEELGRAPDELYIPVGNAGNIHAYWRGFTKFAAAGRIADRPVLRGFQADGAAPIVLGRRVMDPNTVASALEIGNPENWDKATAARDESGGSIEAVSDRAILAAYDRLARLGLFSEPASAVSVAGLLDRAGRRLVDDSACVVCVLTGSGLKDPEAALSSAQPPLRVSGSDADQLHEVLGL